LRSRLRRAIPCLLVRSRVRCAKFSTSMWGETVPPACVLPVKTGIPNATGEPGATILFDPYLGCAPHKYKLEVSGIGLDFAPVWYPAKIGRWHSSFRGIEKSEQTQGDSWSLSPSDRFAPKRAARGTCNGRRSPKARPRTQRSDPACPRDSRNRGRLFYSVHLIVIHRARKYAAEPLVSTGDLPPNWG
jgi:hypothetical protein